MNDIRQKGTINRRMIIRLALLLVVFAVIWLPKNTAYASVSNPTAAAKISFTFDDSLQSAYTQAQPTLAKYGLTGTSYVITGCVGMTKVPNTCHANTDAPYMTWAQIKQLQTDGWEIGSHTVDHPCLASSAKTDPDDCSNAAPLTTSQVTAELANSKSALASQGFTATSFAPPYGDFNNNVLAQIAKYYTSMRQFKNAANNPNVWPYNDYYLQNYVVQETTNPVSAVESAIDTAVANHQWLILTFHDILPAPSTDPDDYQYGTAELDQIAAYVKAKQTAGVITPVNITQGLVTSTTNLLANSSFDSGVAAGWTTDAPTTITKDTGNNGSMPSATNSIKLTAVTTKDTHLFSPKVAVASNTTYLLKNFLDVSAITSGAVGFYVDEYDAAGNWLSGQYETGEPSKFVEELNFTYKPTSALVKSASLQVIVPQKSGATAYLDNVQWFALGSAAQPANLVANGAFDDGIADGWTTDSPTTITADNASHGSPNNPVNSVHLAGSSTTTHLFSPEVSVDPTQSYSLLSYLNLQQIASGGEVGFYIDEYDANGNWISGQYKTSVTSVSNGDIGFTYKPSSATVKSASLQIIVTANSNVSAYYDDVRWYLN